MSNPNELLTCPMCGHHYDPMQNAACPSCPLHAQCNLACCPNCGYQTVNQDRSRLASWFKKLGLRLQTQFPAGKGTST